ncbi:MAG: hypothetical protein J3K34DRAFT_389864 [Monoraphidium minutum]|nr:MAG: hypothetical protein J3K34DRAFT_389864 [Monoraphidium minutum]
MRSLLALTALALLCGAHATPGRALRMTLQAQTAAQQLAARGASPNVVVVPVMVPTPRPILAPFVPPVTGLGFRHRGGGSGGRQWNGLLAAGAMFDANGQHLNDAEQKSDDEKAAEAGKDTEHEAQATEAAGAAGADYGGGCQAGGWRPGLKEAGKKGSVVLGPAYGSRKGT